MMKKLAYDNNYLAYNQLINKKSDEHVVFLHGLRSDMGGKKAIFLEDFCKKHGFNYTKFDYFGHGNSSGEFFEGTIGTWYNNVITILDELVKKPAILIGSSMGGWLSLLAAIRKPESVKALIGLAPAPDFTEELIWNLLPEEKKQELNNRGMINFGHNSCDHGYPISKNLIEEARNHLILEKTIDIHCPVIFIHGMDDEVVPYDYSIKLSEKIATNNLRIILQKGSDHRLSSESDLQLLESQLLDLKLNKFTSL